MKKLYNFLGPILLVLLGIQIFLFLVITFLPEKWFLHSLFQPEYDKYGALGGLSAHNKYIYLLGGIFNSSSLLAFIAGAFYLILGIYRLFSKKHKMSSKKLILRGIIGIIISFALFFFVNLVGFI